MFAIFPELLLQGERGDIEALSCLVRKYFGEQQTFVPNLNVTELSANVGIEMHSNLPKAAAKLEAWDAQGRFRMVLGLHPEIRNPREVNYIMAQMLGHVFLDLQPKMAAGELQRTIFEKKESPLRQLIAAPEAMTPADAFALALLMPVGMLKKAMSALSMKRDVAAFFNVDPQVLELRLHLIGYGAGATAAAPRIEIRAAAPRAKAATPPQAKANPTPKPSAPRRAEPTLKQENKPRTEAVRPSSAAAVPPPAAAAKANAPAKAAKDDLSSLTRVKRSVAAMSYKKEEQREEHTPAPESTPRKSAPSASGEKKSPGLEKLRSIARKIDKSVD